MNRRSGRVRPSMKDRPGTRAGRLVVVAAAVLGAVECSASRPVVQPSPTHPVLTPDVVSTFGVHVPILSADRVVLPEVLGAGTRDLGRLRVPARYSILWHCVGGPAWVRVDGVQQSGSNCYDHPVTITLARPTGTASVTIKVSTDSRTVWALAVVAARH
ncbi:MAG TPA: hypothetical protein VFQ85_19435 [Mycobacteriales bacterium]|jgi:hypothetical protein|nr:hypothetical protein [Mycobacteriales bacterium]